METPSTAHSCQHGCCIEAGCDQHLRQELRAFQRIHPEQSTLLKGYPIGEPPCSVAWSLQAIAKGDQGHLWRRILTRWNRATEVIPMPKQNGMCIEPQLWQCLQQVVVKHKAIEGMRKGTNSTLKLLIANLQYPQGADPAKCIRQSATQAAASIDDASPRDLEVPQLSHATVRKGAWYGAL